MPFPVAVVAAILDVAWIVADGDAVDVAIKVMEWDNNCEICDCSGANFVKWEEEEKLRLCEITLDLQSQICEVEKQIILKGLGI